MENTTQKSQVKSFCRTYAKAIVIALSALMLAVCFLAVAFSGKAQSHTQSAQPGNTQQEGANNATPRAVTNGNLYYTTDGAQKTGTLNTAIDAIIASSSGGTITLYQDIEVTVAITVIPYYSSTPKNIVIDLAEFKLYVTAETYIEIAGGNVTIQGGLRGELLGSNIEARHAFVYTGGNTVTMKGGKVTARAESATAMFCTSPSSSFIMTGGTISALQGTAVDMYAKNFTMTGGLIEGTRMDATAAGSTGIFNTSSQNITINGGTIQTLGTKDVAALYVSGNINTILINNEAQIIANSVGNALHLKETSSSSKVSVEIGGSVSITATGGNAIHNIAKFPITVSGNAKISTTNGTGIFNSGVGKITVNDNARIEALGAGSGIYNTGNAAIAISGTPTISTLKGSGIYTNGALTMEGGTVEVTNNNTVGTGNAIFINGNQEIKLKSGSVTAKGKNTAIMNTAGSTIDIENVTVSAEAGRAIDNSTGGTVSIYGDTSLVSSTSGVAIYDNGAHSVGIASGVVSTETGIGIHVLNQTHLSIVGGEVTATGENGIAVKSSSRDTFNVHGVNIDNSALITAKGSGSIGFLNDNGTVKMTAGKIIASDGATAFKATGTRNDFLVHGGEITATTGVAVDLQIDIINGVGNGSVDIRGPVKISATSGVAVCIKGGGDFNMYAFEGTELAEVTVTSGTAIKNESYVSGSGSITNGDLVINSGIIRATAEGGTAIDNEGEAMISGGTISGVTYAIKHKSEFGNDGSFLFDNRLYISHTPVITCEGKAEITTNAMIDGAEFYSAGVEYSGELLRIVYTGELKSNERVVQNNTNKEKFVLVENADWVLGINGTDLVLKAVNTTVTFNYGGVIGTNQVETIHYDTKIARPTNPTAVGFVFEGWFNQSAFTTPFDFENTVVGDPIQIYAKWTLAPLVLDEQLDVNKTYDGSVGNIVITVTTPNTDKITYTYAWTYKGVAIANTTNTVSYKNVADSGAYVCVVTATFNGVGGTTMPAVTAVKTVNVTIDRQAIAQDPTATNKKYTGTNHTSGLEDNDVYNVVTDAGGITVGDYSVELALTDNYSWADGTRENKTVTYKILNTDKYLAFMLAHENSITIAPATMTYKQFNENVGPMVTAYGLLDEVDIEQFTAENKEKILALIDKYGKIVAAKAAADAALAALDGATVETIRTDGIAALNTKIGAANTEIGKYSALSTGLSAEIDLPNYAALGLANTLANAYATTLGLVESALNNLDGITAQGIKDKTFGTLDEVKALRDGAQTAYNNFNAAGGKPADLATYANIETTTNAIVAYELYDTFYQDHHNTWGIVPNEIALTDGNKITALKTDYEALSLETKGLLSTTEKANITAVTEKYAEIVAAKAAADAALLALKGATAETIRTDRIAALNTKIGAANTAIGKYSALSTGLSAENDLTNYAALGLANTLSTNYANALKTVNDALKALKGISAESIREGAHEIGNVRVLYGAANTAYTNFYAAGGNSNHIDLVGYSNLNTVKLAIAAYELYDTFYQEHHNTWGIVPNEIALLDGNKITALKAAYEALSAETKGLLSTTEKANITAVTEKYAEIVAAKSAADAALLALKGATVETIRTDGIAALNTKISAANTEIGKYSALSTGLSAEDDLSNYTAFTDANALAVKYATTLNAANTALNKIKDLTAKAIQDDTFTYSGAKTLVAEAKAACEAFYNAGGAYTNSDLTGYAKIEAANVEIAAYEAYTVFYTAHEGVWTLPINAITNGDLANLEKLKKAYAEFSKDTVAMGLITSDEKLKIEAILEKYNLIDTAQTKVIDALNALDGPTIETIRANGIDLFAAGIEAATNAIAEFVGLSSGGLTVEDFNGYVAYTQADGLVRTYNEKLLAANKALEAIKGKTALGLKDGTAGKVEDLKVLVEKAKTAYDEFFAAGGENSDVHELVGHEDIELVSDQITGFEAYEKVYAQKTTWEIPVNEIKNSDLPAIANLSKDYASMAENTIAKALFETPVIAAIENSVAQYKAIVKAQEKVKGALSTLAGATVETIRSNGITDFEDSISLAKTAVEEYKMLSNGLAESDFTNYAVYTTANGLVANYNAKLAIVQEKLAVLKEITAQGIKDGKFNLTNVKAQVAAANKAYDEFYAAGGTDKNLSDYALLKEAESAVSIYEGYKAFYDKHHETWDASLDESVKLSKDKVQEMGADYNTLSEKEKELLTDPIRKTIESIVENYKENDVSMGFFIASILLLLLIIAEIIYLWIRRSRNKKAATKAMTTCFVMPIGLLAASGLQTANVAVFWIVLAACVGLGVAIALLTVKDFKKKAKAQPAGAAAANENAAPVDGAVVKDQSASATTGAEVGLAAVQALSAKENSESKIEIQSDEDGNESVVQESNGHKILVQYNFSYKAKLIQATPETQEAIGKIADVIKSFSMVKSTTSWTHARYYIGRDTLALLLFRGRTPYLALPLNPADYADAKEQILDMSGNNSFAKLPLLLRLTDENEGSLANRLIEKVMKLNNVRRGETVVSKHAEPFKSTEQLAEKSLVKVTTTEVY